MRERIVQIMEAENLTPSLFADKLNIGRAVISHILNGRNNPSLDVVMRILDTIGDIDADWLLSGKGTMYKSSKSAAMPNTSTTSDKVVISSMPTDLFDSPNIASQVVSKPSIDNVNNTQSHTEADVDVSQQSQSKVEAVIDQQPISNIIQAVDKKISKVIIYYSDNTFQAFNPDNTPL